MAITSSPSKHVRLLLAQGLTVAQVAEQTRLRPSEVEKIRDRNNKAGRPGGGLDLESQVKWARRITQSAQSEHSKQLAAALLSSLMTDALRAEIREGRG